MLEIILILALIGTALIGGILGAFEWRALGGYWQLKTKR